MNEEIESSNLEDNIPMVNYIMLHRIYDILTLIASKLVDTEDVNQMVKYHENGYLLGPAPSFTPNEEKEND